MSERLRERIEEMEAQVGGQGRGGEGRGKGGVGRREAHDGRGLAGQGGGLSGGVGDGWIEYGARGREGWGCFACMPAILTLPAPFPPCMPTVLILPAPFPPPPWLQAEQMDELEDTPDAPVSDMM